VSRGADGDEIAGKIERVWSKKCADTGKALVEIDLPHVTHVEINRVWDSILAHAFAGDGAGDDIARGEFELGMVTLHEALAAIVAKIGSFTAESLGQQEARRTGQREGGGVELVELHVGQFGASSDGEGDSIAGSYGGVGGV
jgi:hypothetical protein